MLSLTLEEVDLLIKNLNQMDAAVAKMQRMKKYIIKHQGKLSELDKLSVQVSALKDKLLKERSELLFANDRFEHFPIRK